MADGRESTWRVDKTPPDAPHRAKVKVRLYRASLCSSHSAPREPRAVFGDGRGKEGRRFCDPGAAVVINILFAGEIALLFSRGFLHVNAADKRDGSLYNTL